MSAAGLERDQWRSLNAACVWVTILVLLGAAYLALHDGLRPLQGILVSSGTIGGFIVFAAALRCGQITAQWSWRSAVPPKPTFADRYDAAMERAGRSIADRESDQR